MNKHTPLQNKLHEELEKIQKTAEELTLLKSISKDLKKYQKMLPLKKND